MDPFTLLFFGVLWLIFSRVRKGMQQQGTRPLPPRPLTRGNEADPTQQEGSRLEALFRELERTLNEQAGQAARTPPALPPVEEIDEGQTLETEPGVVSLEQEVRRAVRPRVVRDEEAEQVEQARVAAAETRSGPLTRADHAAFDARIRAQPADATAVRAPTPEQLRRAVVWREILGPPLSVRDLER